MSEASFACASLIKEIGRGAKGARALSGVDAEALYAAMLDGRVDDLSLGAIVMAYRIKGETAEELAGMYRAAQRSLRALTLPDGRRGVSIPSYNGARKQANLTPLLGLLLARHGVPVLIHGVRWDSGRVTTAEILARLGHAPAGSREEAETALASAALAFLPIDVLSAPLARLLALRERLGVRNTTHTLVKLLQPFAQPGLRLVNYTHPAYRDSLAALFSEHPAVGAGDVLLARGTEGEAVADTRRQVRIDWFRDGVTGVLVEASARAQTPASLPALDAASTADWTQAVLDGRAAAPANLLRQVDDIVALLSR